jgi:alkylation response protein AidB-like acyl-CoA dehydrogenase
MPMIDFTPDDTPELKAWRAEVREFLETELPEGMHFDYDFSEDPEGWDAYLAFWRKVGEKGWVALTWPKEYYGQARSAIEHWIMHEEFSAHAAPSYPIIGMAVASAILRHGTHEQRLKHLKGIAEVTTLWGEGYTEPGAGSDLASLTTRAHLDGDHWVINGQKTLGTAAHRAQSMFVLARTDPNAKPHAGISAFLVPLDAPGVTMLPLHNMADGQQNQTFFDNVRVPVENLIGTPHQAWSEVWFRQGGESLDNAGPAPEAWTFRMQRALNLVRRFVHENSRGGRPLIEDPLVRQQLAELEMSMQLVRLHVAESYSNFAHRRSRIGSFVYTSNLHLSFYKELAPRFTQICMEIVGPASQIQSGPWAHLEGRLEKAFRASFGNHAGGTPQLKRMTLATRGLGLPR